MQSAKTNLNVEQVFFSIARDIKQRLVDTDSRAEVFKLPALSQTILLEKKIRLLELEIIPILQLLKNFLWLQPSTIKINQPDQGAGAGQAAQRSACCGST